MPFFISEFFLGQGQGMVVTQVLACGPVLVGLGALGRRRIISSLSLDKAMHPGSEPSTL